MEIALQNKGADHALDIAIKINLERGLFTRWDRSESYGLIAGSLSEDQIEKFRTALLNKNLFTLWEIADICKIDNDWSFLIRACEKKGNRLSDIRIVIIENKESLSNFPSEQVQMLKVTIDEYVNLDSQKSRHGTIKWALQHLLSLDTEKIELFQLITELKEKFSRRKSLLGLLDSFLEENNLQIRYVDYKNGNVVRTA